MYCELNGVGLSDSSVDMKVVWKWIKSIISNVRVEREELKMEQKKNTELLKFKTLCEEVMSENDFNSIEDLRDHFLKKKAN